MKILHVAPSFYPATWWGGPIWSTKAICDGINRAPGLDLRVLTTDAASPDRSDRIVPAHLPYRTDYTWRVAGHSIAPAMISLLPNAVGWADVVHLTGTYNFPTLPTLTLARVLGKPVVWSPRGALQATENWDAAPNKRRKAVFEKIAQRVRPENTVLHVTSYAEEAQSVTRLPGIDTAMIPNCVDIPAPFDRPKRSHSGLRLLYLGRLHPKKGIELLIDAMHRLPETTTLDIYGTGSADYVRWLRDLASAFGARICFKGHAEGTVKADAFANADLFVLPSHSENFGIVVAEALAHAIPVITTTATPWTDLERMRCGRCINLSDDTLSATIADLSRADLGAMGQRGRDWMRRDFSPQAMTTAFAALYRSLVMHPSEMVLA